MSPARGVRYWLFKTEPGVFSWEDLEKSPGRRTLWDGVRNYQARNLLRDAMAPGDLAIFYHSEATPPAAVGIVRITKTGIPDPTQFDSGSPYHDPRSRPEEPRWFAVEVAMERPLPLPVTLVAMRSIAALAGMELLRRGNRLSVQPVTPGEWKILERMGGLARGSKTRPRPRPLARKRRGD